MWICPTCSRKFNKKITEHSCITVDLSDHFEGKPAVLQEVYSKVEKAILKNPEVDRVITRSAILFTVGKTFAAIRIQKKNMVVEFLLEEELNEFPVYKVMRISKSRITHFVSVYDHDDLGEEVYGLLKQSYKLALVGRK